MEEVDVPGEERRALEVEYDSWNNDLGSAIERNREMVKDLVMKCACLKVVTFSGCRRVGELG